LCLVLAATLIGAPVRTVPLSKLWAGCISACLVLMIPFWLNLWVASRLYVAGITASDSEGNPAKAIQLHREVIALEPFHAGSYAELARLFNQKYQQHHDPTDQTAADAYLRLAYHYKKDVRYRPNPS